MPVHHRKANAARSKVRSAIEHVFAGQKHRMGLFVRTIAIARAEIKIGMANLVYNFSRLAWLSARAATPKQVALAWLMTKPAVTAPIASATSLAQLKDLFAAANLELDRDVMAELDTASAG